MLEQSACVCRSSPGHTTQASLNDGSRADFSAIVSIDKKSMKITFGNLVFNHALSLHSKLKKYMNSVQLLGLAAGGLTTAAFLPQVIKTWKSRSAKDLSLGMFSLFCLGVFLWLVYGIIVRDIPVIAANLLTLMLASTLLFFKLRFKE